MLEKVSIIKDFRGELIVFENGTNLDFDPIRSYLIFNNISSEPRGFHAHKKLNQLIICLRGSCNITIVSKSFEKFEYHLNDSYSALRIFPMTWREIYNMTDDCILLVFCDMKYDVTDYIYTFEDFKKLCNV